MFQKPKLFIVIDKLEDKEILIKNIPNIEFGN